MLFTVWGFNIQNLIFKLFNLLAIPYLIKKLILETLTFREPSFLTLSSSGLLKL